MLERQNAEEELERYRRIVESLPDGVFLFDLEGNVTSVNNVVLSYGYKKEDVIGKSLLEFIPEKHWQMISEHVADLVEGKSTKGEVELNTKKGTVIAEFRSSPIKKRGKIIGFQSIVRDITERKKAEKALEESEQKLRDFVDTSPDAIVWIDTTGEITLVNRKVLEVTGFPEKHFIRRNFMDVKAVTQESKMKILEKLMERIDGVDMPPYEVEVVTKNGEVLPFELSASPIFKEDKIVGVQSIWRDLRERKRAEEMLRDSEKKYRLLYETIRDGIVATDLDGCIVECNQAYADMLGYSKDELKNLTWQQLTPKQWHQMEAKIAKEQVMKRGYSDEYEKEYIRKDGTVFPISIRIWLIKGEDGKRKGKWVITRDITERKQMEDKLKESEERFRNLYESIPDALAVYVGKGGYLLDYNKVFKKRYGYTDEELKGKIFLDFVHPDWHAMLIEEYRKEHPEEELPFVCEIDGVTKKGESIPIEISAGPYKKKGRVIGIEVIHRDITERKAMERKLQEYTEHLEEMVDERTKELRESQERLLKSERLAAIGQLATMVGHDLRNPLAAIQNASYYLKMKLGASKDEKIKKMFKVVDREINYANNIVKDLLNFSRVKNPDLKKVDLISSIQDALAQLKFPENITLTTKFSEAPAIEADPDQLRRIFQNIALNGIQAMPNGGELTVSARKNGDFTEVAFTDTGVGIPEENIGKLFAPLFTTKAQGVGLGLAICKNLVESHNGRVEVKSKVGEGSTFTVKLPIHQTKGGEKQV